MVLIHLICMANNENYMHQGHEIKRGEVVTGWKALGLETGITAKKVITALKHLTSIGEISQKTKNKFNIITVCNWDEYNGEDKHES